ncbi:NAD(P)H-hydrate dehydratase [Hymenobacter sp. 5516J-16]|nr:ADP/ATP-dependent (S)-NAD(P)H-hydrate dehydratase [Hymenobacter sp. 5516J-16]UOQ75700.1 NAD(P)H-hydrate dehydratase [Hymenobacter sp. 5516J-16]
MGKPARDDYHRLEQLRAFVREHGCYCVLKGAYTTLAAPDGTLYFNSTGNPGMATGGSGDVLTGLLLALRADKRLSPLDAALLGLYAHGRAGDQAAQQTGEAGLVAGDLIRFIGPCCRNSQLPYPAFNPLNRQFRAVVSGVEKVTVTWQPLPCWPTTPPGTAPA